MSVKSAGHLSAKQQDVINAWKKLHPDFKIVLHEDPDMLDLVTEHYPQFLNLYLNTVDSVERVDIWRYLIMHHQGGVYADSDWKPVVPVYEWHTNINPNGTTAPDVLLGYEEAYSFFGDLQIIQWGFYSVPGHPLFLDTVNHIHHMYIDELLTSHYRGDAVQRTGPEPFTWSVLRYLQQRGDVVLADLSRTHSLRLDDFLIGSVDKFDGKPGILAEHLFSGTWKSDSWDDESKPRDWQLKSRRGFEKKVIEFWNAKMGPL